MQAPSVSVVSSLVDVFPTGAVEGAPRAELEAARGEWEAFQIVVRAGNQPLAAVSAEAAPLEGPGPSLPLRLSRVGYVEVRTPSSIEGKKGAWPDPLIPAVDGFVGERRNAFPLAVPRGEARAIWVELFVPESASPGRYRGSVTVMLGARTARVPVELTVHRFALPRTSSLPVTFGFSGNALEKVHGPLSPAERARLAYRYGVSALRHRLSLHGGSFEPAPYTVRPDGKMVLDFTAYDAEVGPFLDGTADRGGPAFGARATTIDLRVPARLVGPLREQYIAEVVRHFRARGWLDRLFDYTFDEPAKDKFALLRTRAELVHKAAPEVPRLVTKELVPDLVGAVDIWCPCVNYLDDKPGNSATPARAAYEARLRRGERIFWYHACMSHGCDIVGGEYFTGWPSYVIDTPPVAQRIFEWLTFRYRIGGELYYNVVESYLFGKDPFQDGYVHGGNGDGTLLYPGRPDRIGGHTHIPIETIRLARIRDGFEDYEYLRLYAARFGDAAAQRLVTSIAPRTYQWDHHPEHLLAARHEIARALDGE